MCALVLMILDVPIEAIEHDYFLTNNLPAHVLRERIEEVAKIGMPEQWALTDERMIVGVRDHLDENYGGLEAYLDGIGVGKEERYMIRENLLY
jgi:protein-tyrosine phosphatase